jgi:methyl-accepting chemotaxis protein
MPTSVWSESDRRIHGRLEQARGRLEARFLEGGEVLTQALEAVGGMISLLDKVTAAFDKQTVDATVSELAMTAEQLRELPRQHAVRQSVITSLSAAGAAIQDDVDAMLETLRYLRTFAVTVKITGAGAAAFSSFADEMLERIQFGRKQVDQFADLLRRMREQVKTAVVLGHDLDVHYQGEVPQLAADLSRDASRMGEHYTEIQQIASLLAELARRVQGKVAKILSALQIGDMTRQRVEHVQAGLAMLEADEAMEQSTRAAMLALLAGQIDDLLEEFQCGCVTITSSLGGLAADTKEIVALGRKARGGSDASSGGFLQALEGSVGSASRMVGEIEDAGIRAAQIGQSSAETAEELIEKVGSIRSIRSDIQYMAINTSLRCSRMGEAGKPMNVVASELRVFAEQMETVSGRLLTGLNGLADAAAKARAGGKDASSSLRDGLDTALATIKNTGLRVADNLKDLSARGDHVARSVGQGVSRLDFTKELGDILDECAMALAQAAADAEPEGDATDEGREMAAQLAEALFAKYTMAREREVHRRFFPVAAPVEAKADEPVADDLDAVLF